MSGRAGIGSVCTSLVLIVIGTVTAGYGAALATATLDVRRLYDEVSEATQNGIDPANLYRHVIDRTRLWVEIPGLQAPAHDLRIEVASLSLDPAGLARLQTSLEDHLAIEPTSSLSWVRLGRARALAERPMAEVEKALQMSVLTGRYEATSMYHRILLAMAVWSDLSEDSKRNTRNEIKVLAGSLTGPEHQRIKNLVQLLPQQTRTEILALFQAAGRRL